MSDTNDQSVSLNLVTEIVCAFLSNNSMPNNQIPDLITSVHHTLMNVGEKAPETLEPAVPIKKSVNPDYIICLEDGKKFKSLKRHLRTHYDLSPEEYREKWGLAHDYPMVAPNYARARSDLAKRMGLGQRRR